MAPSTIASSTRALATASSSTRSIHPAGPGRLPRGHRVKDEHVFGDAQAVEAEQHRQRGVGVVEPLGREQGRAEFAAVHAVALCALDLRETDVLRGVRRMRPSM